MIPLVFCAETTSQRHLVWYATGVLQSFVPDFIRELGHSPPPTRGEVDSDSARHALASWLQESDPGRRDSYARFAVSKAFHEMRPREHIDLRQVWTGGGGEPSRL